MNKDYELLKWLIEKHLNYKEPLLKDLIERTMKMIEREIL